MEKQRERKTKNSLLQEITLLSIHLPIHRKMHYIYFHLNDVKDFQTYNVEKLYKREIKKNIK